MATPRKTTPKTNTHVQSVAKLQFDVLTKTQKAMETIAALPDSFAAIKASVEEIKDNFAYQLQEFEIEHNDKKAALDATLEAYKLELEAEQEALNKNLEDAKLEKSKALEALDYEHELAIRDRNLRTAKQIAEEYAKTLVDNNELSDLRKVERLSESERNELVQNLTQTLTEKHQKAMSAALESAKNKFDIELLSYSKDNESYAKEVAMLKETIAKQEATIQGLNKNIVEVTSNMSRAGRETIIDKR